MDWTHVLTALLAAAAAILGVMFKGWGGISALWHKQSRETKADAHAQSREDRADEVSVLHEEINLLRIDRDALRKEIAVANDRNTTCLIRQGLLEERVKWLEKALGKPEEKVGGTHEPHSPC